MLDTRQFFTKIVEVAPEFQDCVDEHLADHEELLTHVLMGDLSRFVASCFTAAKTPPVNPRA